MTRTIYAVRKRFGRWTVCSGEKIVLQFENYDEAIGVAQSAAGVITHRPERDSANRHESDNPPLSRTLAHWDECP